MFWNNFYHNFHQKDVGVVLFAKHYIQSQEKVIFIGPESDHWECLSLTDSLPNSLPFSKLD